MENLKEKILADIVGVDIKSIRLHKSATVRVDEAIEAMGILEKYYQEKIHDNNISNCYDAIQYCDCENPKSPSMNRCVCSMCGFVIPLDKQ